MAVPPDRDDEPVREFPSFTVDLNALADWLKACGVDTVAMESTGVYWIPLFELLESRGFTVLLVNARHVKNVSGRKSDVLDCQWLQQLMTYGLLRGAFRPADAGLRAALAVAPARDAAARARRRHVQHMQKALTQMNIQLANVISDVVGDTGQKILRAIVAGERDGHVLAAMKQRAHPRQRRGDRQEPARQLAQPSICLRSSRRWPLFDFVGTQLAECDHEIEQQLQSLQRSRWRARQGQEAQPRAQRAEVRSARAVVQDVRRRSHAHRRHRRDHGAGGHLRDRRRHVALRHRQALHEWLGLCPGTKITGGKVMSGKTKRVANRAAQALRLAAAALRSSQSALGAYFSRMCSRMDKPKAVTAAAHKLARLIYTMLTKGEEYTDQGQDYYEERYRERVLRQLTKRAEKLGMQLIPVSQPI